MRMWIDFLGWAHEHYSSVVEIELNSLIDHIYISFFLYTQDN